LANDHNATTDFEAALTTLRGSLEAMKRLVSEARQIPPSASYRGAIEPSRLRCADHVYSLEGNEQGPDLQGQRCQPRAAAVDKKPGECSP
jgi:hypothetical protein